MRAAKADAAAPRTDFARLMEPVALALLGAPNAALSSGRELRFGKRGSLHVDLAAGRSPSQPIRQIPS
jgi:hypothetical protein